MQTLFDHLIGLFGSQRAIAEAMGVGESTVSMWKRQLPDATRWRLLAHCREHGLPLDEDLLGLPPVTEPEAHRDAA